MSRPEKAFTFTFGWFRKTSRVIWTRSSTVKSGAFSVLQRTATRTRSKMWQPRWTRSTCPFVIGSNEPG